jgi:hypothetical protein
VAIHWTNEMPLENFFSGLLHAQIFARTFFLGWLRKRFLFHTLKIIV